MSCLVKLYTQAFYNGVASGGPQSIANYRIARAKVDTFESLAATALERYLEDCPHAAGSVKIDIVLDDGYFHLHPKDSLDLLEKGEVTHVVLNLPPKLSRSARAASVSRAASVGRSASRPGMDLASTPCITLSDDSTGEDIIAAPVPKKAAAKSRRSSSIAPPTSKSRAQIPKDAEILSISSGADEDADDEATQRPQTRGRSPVKRDARQENETDVSAQFKDAALEATRQNRSTELAGTKDKKAVQKTLLKPKSASTADPYEVPSSDEDLQVKQERTTPRKTKSRAPVMPAKPTQRPTITSVGSGGASARPTSPQPKTPAVIPSDAKVISIADTSDADEAGDSDVPSVRHQPPGSRHASGLGDRGPDTRLSSWAKQIKNGKRPMQHRVNENIKFMSPATCSGNAEEGRAEKPPIVPRFSVANSRGVFPLYLKKGSQPEATSIASELPMALRTGTPSSKSPHTRKMTWSPPSSAPAKISASESRVTRPSDQTVLIRRFREERDHKEKEWEAEQRRKEDLNKASAMNKPEIISPEAAIDSLVGKRRVKLASKKKPKPIPVGFLKEPEHSDDDMSEIIHPPAALQGTPKRGGVVATDSVSGSQTITFTPSLRKLKYSGADFKPMNTLNPKLAIPQSPPSTNSSKFSSYPPHVQKAFSDPESSDEGKEAPSDSEASVTSQGSHGERRFHVEELADDGLPKAFKAWQDKYGSTFRHDEDLPYLYIDDGPWEGLIVDGKHSGKYIGGCRPPSADLITTMTEKAVPRFSELSEAANSSSGESEEEEEEEEEEGRGDGEVTLPPIDHSRQATPPSSWSDDVHIREQFEMECPPSNQELGILMSSSPLRTRLLGGQVPLLEQTPSQRTCSKMMDWEEELNVTPDTERAMSQVETPQTKSRASALKNASIVVEIAEPSEAQRAEYKKMPEVNAQVLASAPKRLSDINAKSEHIATASQESGLAVVDYVMNQSPAWLKTVDLTDFQTDKTVKAAGKRRGSMLELAAETPSRPSMQVTTSGPLKRKAPLYAEQDEKALLGRSSSIPSEDLSSVGSDEPHKALKSHAQESPSKHFPPCPTRQSAAGAPKRKATSSDELQDSTRSDTSSKDGPETSGDFAVDSPRKASKLHAHDTPRRGPVRSQGEPRQSTNEPTGLPKASKKKHSSKREGGVGTQVVSEEGDARSLDQGQEKGTQKAMQKAQGRKEKRKRYKAKKKQKKQKEHKAQCQKSMASSIGAAPSQKQQQKASKSLATPPNSSRPPSAGYAT